MDSVVVLKPCPFCGNSGDGPTQDALHVVFQEHDWRDNSWTVQCDKCTATMGYSDSEDEAIATWNTRLSATRADERPVEVERLRHVIDRDRYIAANALNTIRAALSGRHWLREPARGSYAYDDERYQLEFGAALDEIEQALLPLAKLASDKADCTIEPAKVQVARDDARAALAHPPAVVAVPAGWIVGNGDGTRWRTWKEGWSAWTSDRSEATRYARREDAEAVHQEDEDAWRVVPYAAAPDPSTPGEVGAVGDVERLRELVAQVEAGQFDAVETVADKWAESVGVRQMMNAIASVFEKHASQEIMDRFRDKLAALMHLAFVEGAVQGVMQFALAEKPA